MRTAAARALSARSICRNRPDQPFTARSAVSGLPPVSTIPLAEKGGELVSLILRRLERWHSSVDPAWYRYAGLPAGTPSHRTARGPFGAGVPGRAGGRSPVR